MTIDAKRVGLATIVFAGALFLHGCAGRTIEPATIDATPEESTPVTIDKSRPDPSVTIRLIDRLDAAGCDFTGVTITEGVHRKQSLTTQILCRGL
jgi:hypothetical protein